MPKAAVYDMTGKQVGEIELSDAIFGVTPNLSVMHDVVRNHLANRRQGTHSTLTRAEVRGGGRKPWRQKGTGRARHGSIRSPQWTHGGIVFGPKPRSYRFSLNKKTRRLALKSALSSKALAGDIIVVDNLQLDEVKTKNMVNFLKAVGAENGALVVTPNPRENVILSSRNIPGVKTTIADVINVYDILNGSKFIVDREAVSRIEEVFA
jgi:large subunit ribosomal protein L4